MKGVAVIKSKDYSVIPMSPDTVPYNEQSLEAYARQAIQKFITHLDGNVPSKLYKLVLSQVEKPLIEIALQVTNNNQSRAAELLQISRGTFRKKMKEYGLLD